MKLPSALMMMIVGVQPVVRAGDAADVSPLKLVFEKEYQVRNFFNSSIPLSSLDMGSVKEVKTIHHTQPGCSLASREKDGIVFTNTTSEIQETFVSLGALYPYSAVDLDVSAQKATSYSANALLSFYKDKDNWITLAQRASGAKTSSLTLEIFKGGKSNEVIKLNDSGVEAPYTIRVHLSGRFLNCFLVKGDKSNYLKTVDIGGQFDLREKSLCAKFSILAGARLAKGEELAISRLEQYLTCGTGQADPKVLHDENGEPLVDGDKIWLAMTTRGYQPIPASHQGVYSYNIKTREWKVVGDITFNMGDDVLRSWHASDIFYDRQDKAWRVFTVSHGDDHRIYHGTLDKDPRKGVVEARVTRANYKSNGNEEDPSVVYDNAAGKWRMAMCMNREGGYHTFMFESDAWNGKWKEISHFDQTSTTGILIQKVGDKRYVFQCRGPRNYEVLSYPDLKKTGTLNVNDMVTTYNPWPVIIPVPEDDTLRYYLLSFDRRAVTGKYSYGDLYWYSSKPQP